MRNDAGVEGSNDGPVSHSLSQQGPLHDSLSQTTHTRHTTHGRSRRAGMLIRNMPVRTIDSYTHHVDRFDKHFGKPPEDLGPEQIREFQLWLIQEKKCSWSSFNQAVFGIRTSGDSQPE
jgi:hypothetical protein